MDDQEIRKELNKRCSERGGQSRVASDIGVGKSTVSRWLEGSEITPSHLKLLRLYFYGEIPFDDIRPTQDLSNVLKFSEKEWEIMSIIATRNGLTCGEWIAGQIRDYLAFRTAQQAAEPKPANITRIPQKRAHIMAAAGPGIDAEVIDWDGVDDTVAVKICGESMMPLFEDGQIIEMKHKRASRTPYMKKGVIYLVELEGEWMVKRYDTRRPRKDEKDAEYLTGSGMVGILKSENPAFDDIDITGPFEWAAWFDEQS